MAINSNIACRPHPASSASPPILAIPRSWCPWRRAAPPPPTASGAWTRLRATSRSSSAGASQLQRYTHTPVCCVHACGWQPGHITKVHLPVRRFYGLGCNATRIRLVLCACMRWAAGHITVVHLPVRALMSWWMCSGIGRVEAAGAHAIATHSRYTCPSNLSRWGRKRLWPAGECGGCVPECILITSPFAHSRPRSVSDNAFDPQENAHIPTQAYELPDGQVSGRTPACLGPCLSV